jgi:hypothetical protein
MNIRIQYDPAMGDEAAVRKFGHVCMTTVSKELMIDAQADPELAIGVASMLGNTFAISLRNNFFGRRVGKITVEYPSSWWQGLRRDHLPTLTLTRWFPIKWTTRHFDVKEIIPGFQPEVGGVLIASERPELA